MSAMSDAKVRRARQAAERLDASGFHVDAESVRSVCRSNSSLKTTAAQLSADNMALRERLKQRGGE